MPINVNIIAETNENTVISEYEPLERTSEAYQSEAELEAEFIQTLESQGYGRLFIHSEADLVANLKIQLEKLNGYTFTESEWDRFFKDCIANPNEHIVEKTRKIQEDYIQVLKRDDGTSRNIKLIDKGNIHNNSLQVLNQYEISRDEGANHTNRYDVTVLVNGLPLVHIELKRRGVAIKEAFNQIERYQRDSFWAGCGLYEYVQIFVISNGTRTKYYSNTTRDRAIKDNKNANGKKKKTSNSFEFTSFWADSKNKVILDLVDFTRTFFAKHTILSILTRYCVFTSENILLVMRPYQITATEKILNQVEISSNYKKYGSIDAGGYVWHTTGSGKTLTSFKTARLCSSLPFIDKVLFVVDRKDLDYQTMKEYDRFEEGSANSNASTAILQKQLEDDNARIIITTIQKLSTFIKKNKEHSVYQKQVVMIFDECHRSQFGEMHTAITKNFKKYYIFGFTGTPIFAENAQNTSTSCLFTTEQTFGKRMHTYTIVDAINDENVLPFRVDYLKTFDADVDIDDKQVFDIDREAVFNAPERIRMITEYILDHFNQKTYRNDRFYDFNKTINIKEVVNAKREKVEESKQRQKVGGFNSIFAVSSIPVAKKYYEEFQKQMQEHPEKRLNIAIIYSYGANEGVTDEDYLEEENPEDTSALSSTARDFLDKAINDYNKMFNTNYSTDGDLFQNYYKDVSMRMKNKDLDILIVVNMFLTGFDATTLNTLWVDKNLKMHGLIQAFSRTNRILNSIKTFGNIVCFRNLQNRVDKAIARFGDSEAGGVVLLRAFKDYLEGYIDGKGVHHKGYKEMVSELKEKFSLDEPRIEGEQNKKDFVKLFGAILRMRNLLASFDEFTENDELSERDFQDYCGRYQDIRDELRPNTNKEKEDILDDIVFEMELLKQVEINIDYILMLVQKYHDSHGMDKEILVSIQKAIDSSPNLRSKKKLIETFIENIITVDDVVTDWQSFVAEEREKELKAIIIEERLKEAETRKFISNVFRDGEVKTTGTDIESILPPLSRFGGGGGNRAEIKKRVIDKLKNFTDKFFGIGGGSFDSE